VKCLYDVDFFEVRLMIDDLRSTKVGSLGRFVGSARFSFFRFGILKCLYDADFFEVRLMIDDLRSTKVGLAGRIVGSAGFLFFRFGFLKVEMLNQRMRVGRNSSPTRIHECCKIYNSDYGLETAQEKAFFPIFTVADCNKCQRDGQNHGQNPVGDQ
jgi:hypothetical protein